jgi:glycosyltransferase involved in cell wall biosynthesis
MGSLTKLKIAYIAKDFWPSIPAGLIAVEIATRLARHGHVVELLVPNTASCGLAAKQPLIVLRGLTVHYLGPRLSKLPANTISCSFLLFKGISAALRADIILSQHHHASLVSFFSAIISIVTRRPLVVRAEDVVPGNPERLLDKLLCFAIGSCNSWAIKRAKLFLVSSKELAECSQRMYAVGKATVGVSHNGVDTKKFSLKNLSREMRRRFDSEHIVIFSGTLYAMRGLEILLRAAAILKPKIPDMKVLIMGVGPDYSRLLSMAKSLGLGQSVLFLGGVDPDLVPTYLALADIAIGPLRASVQTYGTNPVKVLEYMASGCVVIATKNTASAEILIDGLNGILIESDPVDLAASILRVFSDPYLAARLRVRARETVEKCYDWEKVVSELLLSLDSALTTR